jgi:hypothetical protein
MTTQSMPSWDAEMDRQIKATESAMALAKDNERVIIEQRAEIDKLRGAIERTIRACQLCRVKQCTMESHKWLTAALVKEKAT